MRQVWLGADRRRGTIVLVVFGRVGLGVSELRNFGLVGAGAKHRWSCDGVELSFRDLVHCIQFDDVPRKVWRVGRAVGEFSANST